MTVAGLLKCDIHIKLSWPKLLHACICIADSPGPIDYQSITINSGTRISDFALHSDILGTQ